MDTAAGITLTAVMTAAVMVIIAAVATGTMGNGLRSVSAQPSLVLPPLIHTAVVTGAMDIATAINATQT